MNKKIITIAGIVFALIFVIILAVMMATITNKAENANTKLVDTLDSVDTTSLQAYDGQEVKGEAVVNAIKNVKSLGGQSKLEIIVYTGSSAASKIPAGKDSPIKLTSATDTVASQLSAVTGTGITSEKYGYVGGATVITAYSITDSTNAKYINNNAIFKSFIVKNANDVTVGIVFIQTNQ